MDQQMVLSYIIFLGYQLVIYCWSQTV